MITSLETAIADYKSLVATRTLAHDTLNEFFADMPERIRRRKVREYTSMLDMFTINSRITLIGFIADDIDRIAIEAGKAPFGQEMLSYVRDGRGGSTFDTLVDMYLQ